MPMSGVPDDAAAFRVAFGLAAAAQQPSWSGPGATADAVLEELCAHVPSAAAALVAVDPVRGGHVVLGSTRYQPEVLSFLTSPAFLVDDVGYRLLVREPRRRARAWSDVEGPEAYADTRSATTVFRPAGFAGGATARLVSSDGRYTGDLHLSTDEPDRPAPQLTVALHHAAPVLAAAADLSRRLLALLDCVGVEGPAAVVDPDGRIAPVPGRVRPPGLDVDLAGRVARWRRARPDPPQARFLAPTASGWVPLQLVAIEDGTLVATRPPEDAHALSRREAEVLTLLADGLANATIARRLGISARTTAHHVEHVLGKLRVDCRVAAARLAVEQGLRLLPHD
jgi:DNA-binding CsgD family transcriptional regulator